MEYTHHQYILAAVEALRKANSWTGRTHIQKSLALTSCLVDEDLPFQFVLYKHGPYSFDVDQELDQMLTYDAIKTVPQGQYGPTIKSSEGSSFPKEFGDADENLLKTIGKVAAFVGTRTVIELEALATSAWIRTKEGVDGEEHVLARLKELKPHLAIEVALAGVKDSKKFLHEVKA